MTQRTIGSHVWHIMLDIIAFGIPYVLTNSALDTMTIGTALRVVLRYANDYASLE